jgi:pimeloyl-ACP methyl ester carboxylesterase
MTTFQTAETKSINVNGTKFVYRELGQKRGVPVLFLHHITAVLEDWDPRVVDGVAASHHVIVFDNRGVGGTEGVTPTSVEEMAEDAVAFIRALGLKKVDLFGFSLGGFVSQVIVQRYPDLVRKVLLSGTGPAGGEGISGIDALFQSSFAKAAAAGKHPKQFLFFTQTAEGQEAANQFLARLNERTENRDNPVKEETIGAQFVAFRAWGRGDPSGLSAVQHPVLVANGDEDEMVPPINSFELARRLPNARLSIFPDAGHGGIFQYHDVFVKQALDFLR